MTGLDPLDVAVALEQAGSLERAIPLLAPLVGGDDEAELALRVFLLGAAEDCLHRIREDPGRQETRDLADRIERVLKGGEW